MPDSVADLGIDRLPGGGGDVLQWFIHITAGAAIFLNVLERPGGRDPPENFEIWLSFKWLILEHISTQL